jgi:nitrite reductase/ring-hydroxylating ferredoxin subunit
VGLLNTLLLGRPNGLRARLKRRFTGGSSNPGSPASPAPVPAPPRPAEAALGLHPEAPKDTTPPDGFEVVLHKNALAPGRATEIIIGGTAIAVANVDGNFKACSNTCPHADGPLGEGTLSGNILTCPYHGWEFDLDTGACLTNASVKVPLHEVRVVQDAVCVKI